MQDGLAVSRAMGDPHLRGAGLISTPELSTWQRLDRQQDSFLVLVSDGATEVLSAAQICQITAATESGTTLSLSGQQSACTSPQQALLPFAPHCAMKSLSGVQICHVAGSRIL